MATILCVDDNPSILQIHQALLESNGHRVVTALDGPTGIVLCREQSIDVVVLDFNMPGMDGHEIAQVLMQEQPTLPVVICSGDPEAIPESLRWFAYAVLHKSDGLEALLSVVENSVEASTSTEVIACEKLCRQDDIEILSPKSLPEREALFSTVIGRKQSCGEPVVLSRAELREACLAGMRMDCLRQRRAPGIDRMRLSWREIC